MKNRKYIALFFIFSVIISVIFYHLWYINKGLDFGDTGWYLDNYRRASNLKNFDIGRFYSWYIGSYVAFLNTSQSIIILRLANKVINLVTYLLIFLIFKKHINRTFLITLISLGSLYLIRFPQELSYNNFSFLILVLSFFIYYKNSSGSKLTFMLVGFILGLSVFFRLPNIIAFLLLIICLLIKKQIKQFKYITLGFLFGLIFSIIVIIRLIGFSDFFLSSFHYVFQLLSNDNSNTHSSLRLLYNLAYQVATIFYIVPLFIASIYITFIILLTYFNIKTSDKINKILLFISVLPAGYFAYIINLSVFIWFITLISIIYCLYLWFKDSCIEYLCIPIIVLTFIIGTDNGFQQAYFILPLIIIGIYIETYPTYLKVIPKFRFAFINFLLVIFIIFSFSFFIQLNGFVYGENDKIINLVNIHEQPFIGLRTSRLKADIITKFKNDMKSIISKKPKLIILGDFPIGFSLTNLDSYFSESWSNLNSIFSLSMFENELQNYKDENIVIVIFEDHDSKKNKLLMHFIEHNKFIKMTSNIYYTIFYGGK